MTKKARRRNPRVPGLFKPKPPRRDFRDKKLATLGWKEFYGSLRAAGMNPATVLDATEQELHPTVKPKPIDQPGKRADHALLTGPLIAYLEALIDAAMAHSGALNTDEDPEDVLCEATGLTHLEYEAVVMRTEGCNWLSIGASNGVTEPVARAAAMEGIKKLRRFVQT